MEKEKTDRVLDVLITKDNLEYFQKYLNIDYKIGDIHRSEYIKPVNIHTILNFKLWFIRVVIYTIK